MADISQQDVKTVSKTCDLIIQPGGLVIQEESCINSVK